MVKIYKGIWYKVMSKSKIMHIITTQILYKDRFNQKHDKYIPCPNVSLLEWSQAKATFPTVSVIVDRRFEENEENPNQNSI